MVKHLSLLLVACWMAMTSLIPNPASAYISDTENVQMAEYILSSNTNVRNYFMNMDLDSYSSCAATSIAFMAWEIRGDIDLDSGSQIMWALLLAGTTLTRDNYLASGYPASTLDEMLKHKGDLVMMGGNAQDSVIQGCSYHVTQIINMIQ